MDKKTHHDKHVHDQVKEHKHSSENHHNHHEMMITDFKRRFFISLIVTIPILLLSPMVQEWTNINIIFNGSNYVLFALSTFIYFY